MAMLRVLLHTVGGRQLDLQIDPELSVADLKLRVYARWQLPPLCQKLVAGTRILEASAKLKAFCPDPTEALNVLVIVQLEPAYEGVKKGHDPYLRREAVEALAVVAHRDDKAFAAVADAGADGNLDVRSAAIETLLKVAGEGEGERLGEVICVLAAKLESENPDVRSLAVDALQRVVPKGNKAVFVAVKERTMHPRLHTRVEAVAALPKLVNRGDEEAIEILLSRIKDHEESVILAAVKATVQVAPRGHAAAVAAISSRTDDAQSSKVRAVSLRALGSVASLGDDGVIAVASVHCSNGASPGVRQVAIEVVGALAPFGDEVAIESVAPALGDKYKLVRRAAATALGRLAPKNDKRIVTAVLERFQKFLQKPIPETGLGIEIGEALSQLTDNTDQTTISIFLSAMEDIHDFVRRASAEVLGYLASGDDARVIAALTKAAKDQLVEVAQAAIMALARVTSPGNERTVGVVRECLAHKDSWMRRTAAQAVGMVASRGDVLSTQALSVRCTDDTDSEVVREAIGSLGSVAQPGDMVASAALCATLGHRDELARRAAAEALAVVAAEEDNAASSALLRSLRDSDKEVVGLAATALGKVGPKGERRVIDALGNCLVVPHSEVRRAAGDALAAVAGRGNENAMAAVRDLLRPGNKLPLEMRVDAAHTYGLLALPGDEHALNALYACLEDHSALMRRAAMKALGLITPQA